MEPPHHLTFGPFCLDVTHGCLWRGEQPIALRPRSLAVLQYLVKPPARLVTKAELRRQVWRASKTWLFVVFGESQPVVRDLAEWITRRPCSGPVSQVLFHQKRSIFIWPLVCMALSESGSPHSQTVSPKATMSQEVLAMFAR
jgi:hypothetical protein